VIPVFSLRSEGSFGVGDFGDLKLMIDWCARTKQRILQVLPINDTTITHTWQDSYPYNSISIYALHPQYTDLRQLPALKDEKKREEYETLRKELNALTQIDYERMMAAKMGYLRDIFAQEGAKTMKTVKYKTFFEQNKDWLVPYAAFCHYRDLYGTSVFSEWPKEATMENLAKKSAYKAYVGAWIMKDGIKTYIKSPSVYAYTSGSKGKYTNAKSVTVKKKSVSLKKGKTYQIKASVKKLKKNKKLMPESYAPKLRYLSSNKSVATVSKNGKIKAGKTGTCYVYVYAQNGSYKRITVAVK
jgi:hypothetical protein